MAARGKRQAEPLGDLGPLPGGHHGLSREQIADSQRERLLAAIAHEVATRGYRATTITEVVKLAKVSTRDFYEHFEGKEDCFLAAFEAVHDYLTQLIGDEVAKADDWPHQVIAALRAALRFLAANPTWRASAWSSRSAPRPRLRSASAKRSSPASRPLPWAALSWRPGSRCRRAPRIRCWAGSFPSPPVRSSPAGQRSCRSSCLTWSNSPSARTWARRGRPSWRPRRGRSWARPPSASRSAFSALGPTVSRSPGTSHRHCMRAARSPRPIRSPGRAGFTLGRGRRPFLLTRTKHQSSEKFTCASVQSVLRYRMAQPMGGLAGSYRIRESELSRAPHITGWDGSGGET